MIFDETSQMNKKTVFQMLHLMEHSELKDFLLHYTRYDAKLKLALRARWCFLISSSEKKAQYGLLGKALDHYAKAQKLSNEKEKFLLLVFEDIYGHLLDYSAQKYFQDCYSVFFGILELMIKVRYKSTRNDLVKIIDLLFVQLEALCNINVPVDILFSLRLLISDTIVERLFNHINHLDLLLTDIKSINHIVNDSVYYPVYIKRCVEEYYENTSIFNQPILCGEYFTVNNKLSVEIKLDNSLARNVLAYFQKNEHYTSKETANWIKYYSKHLGIQKEIMCEALFKDCLLNKNIKDIPNNLADLLFIRPNKKFIDYLVENIDNDVLLPIADNVLFLLNEKNLNTQHRGIILYLICLLDNVDLYLEKSRLYNDVTLFLSIYVPFLKAHKDVFFSHFNVLFSFYIEHHFGPKAIETVKECQLLFLKNDLRNFTLQLIAILNKFNKVDLLNKHLQTYI